MYEKKLGEKQGLVVEVGDIARYGGCIVNTADITFLGGSGVDGAIRRAAGPEFAEASHRLGGCATGNAKVIKVRDLESSLPADFVIQTVGPVYPDYEDPEEARSLLSDCYRNSLQLAMDNGIHEISFPAISAGIKAYPQGEAAHVAVTTTKVFLDEHPDYPLLVRFVCYEHDPFVEDGGYPLYVNELRRL